MTVQARESSGTEGKRRHRRWSMDEKRRIVAETYEAGASVSIVARRHDMNANMLFNWRRALGVAGASTSTPSKATMTFVPAVIDAAPTTAVTPAAAPTTTGRMEIALAGGDRLIVDATVDAGALSRVLKALSRR